MDHKTHATEPQIEVYFRPALISLTTGLDSWLSLIKSKVGKRILENLNSSTDHLDRYIEMAEVEELPGAFIACSFYQKDINDALTRAGIYMGAGKGMKAGTLVEHRNFPLLNYKKLVAGHNLPGHVISDFFAEIKSSSAEELKENAAEHALAKSFLNDSRIAKLNGSFYLIGFSIQSMKDQKCVISHEVFHAYHFLNKTYREVVSQFWRDVVSPEDKILITKEIGLAYNVDDEELVIDEFQAYMVQANAELDRMKAFVPKYRAQLLAKLEDANVKILKL